MASPFRSADLIPKKKSDVKTSSRFDNSLLFIDNKGITWHWAGDGKKRVALQSESNKNDREVNREHKKAAA